MNYYPPTIRQLIKQIALLPGIGEKTAERLTLHVLKAPLDEVEGLSRSLLEARTKVRFCTVCFALSDTEICHLCQNPARDPSLICVVEQPSDMIAIEKAGAFKGLYHVLQGTLSPIDGVGPENLRIRELIHKIDSGKVKEVILATGTSVEGEATAGYLAERLASFPIQVSRIASGVPVGGDLKYVDQVTLKRALDTRHTL